MVPGERGQAIGCTSPHRLLRPVEALRGEVEVGLALAARPEYGLVTPQVAGVPGGVEISGAADRLTLTADGPVTIDEATVTARFTLRAGESAGFALRHRRSVDLPAPART